MYNDNTKIMMADCSCMHELKDRLLWPGGMHILIFEIRDKLFHNYNNYDCIYRRGVEEAVTTGEKLALGGLNSWAFSLNLTSLHWGSV